MPQFMPRTRRETDPSDAINARNFEHWQTDARYMTYDRPDMNQRAPVHDMKPNSSRMNNRTSYRAQPRYDPNADRGVQNPYFNKYDTASDARNMVRELRTSVYEDKQTGFLQESEKILARNLENRWMNPEAVREQMQAAEQLRPMRDDFRTDYRKKEGPLCTK